MEDLHLPKKKKNEGSSKRKKEWGIK